MNKVLKITSAVFALAAMVILFIILYKAPFRLDDLTWGGKIGMERLNTFFQTQDGRYVGNLAVIALTRIPAVIRIIVQLVTLVLLFFCVYRHFGREKVPAALFAVLFILMPASIMSSTVTWTAGFANYFFSALFTLAVIAVDLKILDGELTWKENRRRICLFAVLVFLGQFFLETATIYVVLLSVVLAIIHARKAHRVPSEFIIQTVFALTGAAIMFANPSYRSAVTHDGLTHKSIDFGNGGLTGMIAKLWQNYNDEVVYRWFGMNVILNIVLTLIVIAFCIRSRRKLGYFLAAVGVLFEGVFVYDLFDGQKELIISATFMAVLSIVFYLYVAAVALLLIRDSKEKFRMILYIVSHLIFMGPFTIVSPVTDRCLMMNYVIWCLMACEFIRDMHISPLAKGRAGWIAVLCASILTAGYLGWFMTTQRLSWQVHELRMTEVEKCVANDYSMLYLPKCPDAKTYCYGLNIPQDDYWLQNYKDYYGIKSSCHLEFVSLEEWQIKRAFNR